MSAVDAFLRALQRLSNEAFEELVKFERRRRRKARAHTLKQFSQRHGDRFSNAASVSRLRFQKEHGAFRDGRRQPR